ncbi:hypothetical protein M409DRAFT_26277 [Zasmidium cellare ATCC 36951]|uniref:Defect at low temperature protein 1 n=1 Tax=Zasmidium cellare ATCC 36951 TaxID=1080233 RepID=A0A6A6C8S0_ZASCE|nr:uncharacterized protein M409DRAFT_26277 [Zasmidium cellare ATCC 36951]KAF2163233.1 hypothetical protein M409DRAFT_26277 [Zasmidium cellare ATCC 36951]
MAKIVTIAGRRLRFPSIPMFRVFYSLTYTLIYLITLVFLAITPISMLYASIQQGALQYTTMIGGAYVLTIIIAIFIYSSRLYTNRSVLSSVGKAYVPIEDGEVGNMVRKMIVKQLQRSAVVAWESRPRDLFGEILLAAQEGILATERQNVVDKNAYVVGTEIRVDPLNPPWGDVQHPGWSSPSHQDSNKTPGVQFDSVIAELPHLIEARAVSLAPSDPTLTPVEGEPQPADPTVVEVLKRPATMGVREYLTKLAYLGLVQSPEIGQRFLTQYERARFSGNPVRPKEFDNLMSAFAELLSEMTELDHAIIDEIRVQVSEKEELAEQRVPTLSLPYEGAPQPRTPSPPPHSVQSSAPSPVTAREALSSRNATPYLHLDTDSEESFSSVLRHTPEPAAQSSPLSYLMYEQQAPSSSTLPSDSGSVLRHDVDDTG